LRCSSPSPHSPGAVYLATAVRSRPQLLPVVRVMRAYHDQLSTDFEKIEKRIEFESYHRSPIAANTFGGSKADWGETHERNCVNRHADADRRDTIGTTLRINLDDAGLRVANPLNFRTSFSDFKRTFAQPIKIALIDIERVLLVWQRQLA
jgi:hypothetical protein